MVTFWNQIRYHHIIIKKVSRSYHTQAVRPSPPSQAGKNTEGKPSTKTEGRHKFFIKKPKTMTFYRLHKKDYFKESRYTKLSGSI
jgi:hypothetical protein